MIELTFSPVQDDWLEVAWTDVVQDGDQPQRTPLRHTSYHPTQLAMLQADAVTMGTPLTDHMPMLTAWVDSYVPPTPDIAALKAAKNTQINQWRAAANQSYFTYSGKQIACDALSRGDIDAVTGVIALTGAFPAGFPGAWKATDNSYVMLPDVDAFKAMHAAMTAQGTANFMHAQTLKTALAAATTQADIDAIVW